MRLSGAATRIAALEREIDQLLRLDVALVDQAGDGAVHDEATPAPALLGVKVQERSRSAAA